MIPYKIFHVKQPPSLTTYLLFISNVQEVEILLQSHEWKLYTLKDSLALVQNSMKQQANQHHSEISFDVGDMVFLHL